MYQALKQRFEGGLIQRAPWLGAFFHRHKTIIKYAIAGGIAVAANLVVLYVFTDLLGVWYVASSGIAFCVSLAAGFSLQKFWTFRDPSMRRIKRQMAMYLGVGILNLILGPALLYVLVETFALWYLAAQLVVMVLLAGESYLINRFITFKKETPYEGADV